MISFVPEPLPLTPCAPRRRGGPHLIRTLWPEILVSLAVAGGLVPLERRREPPNQPEPPPWSRAA